MQRLREADIEAAKEYLRQRIECENAMTSLLESAMRETAERIVELLYSAKIHPTVGSYENLPSKVQIEIDAVVEWLKATIDDYFLTFAIADHEENRDRILPFILGMNHGMTFDERLTDYVDKYRNELLLLIGAGLFLDISKNVLAKSICDNLKHPYANQLLVDGIAAPLSYGRGKTNSMFTAINSLARFGIGKGWMYHRHLKAEMEHAQGFITFRNSSVPCDMCDDYASYTHPMDDPLPPLHGHCVCGTIYINAFGEPLRF